MSIPKMTEMMKRYYGKVVYADQTNTTTTYNNTNIGATIFPCNGVIIQNRGIADLTLTVNSIDIVVNADQEYQYGYQQFTEVVVTATSDYQIILLKD